MIQLGNGKPMGIPREWECDSNLGMEREGVAMHVDGNLSTVPSWSHIPIPWDFHWNGNMTPTWEWERKGVGMHVDGNLSTVPRVGIIFPFPWDFFRNGNMTPTWEWERKGVGMCVDGNPSTVCIYTIVLLCVCGNI